MIRTPDSQDRSKDTLALLLFFEVLRILEKVSDLVSERFRAIVLFGDIGAKHLRIGCYPGTDGLKPEFIMIRREVHHGLVSILVGLVILCELFIQASDLGEMSRDINAASGLSCFAELLLGLCHVLRHLFVKTWLTIRLLHEPVYGCLMSSDVELFDPLGIF